MSLNHAQEQDQQDQVNQAQPEAVEAQPEAVEGQPKAVEAVAEVAQAEAVEGPKNGSAAEAASKNRPSNKWHAVVGAKVVSAPTKTALKALLRELPISPISCIIRGKQISLRTSISF